MSIYHIIWIVLVCIWVFHLLVPLVGLSLDTLFTFWSRRSKRKGWATEIQKFKRSLIGMRWCKSLDADEEVWIVDFIVGMFLTGVIGGISCALVVLGLPSLGLLYILLSLIGLVFIPRFVMDIIKGLKYSSKSGKLEEIEELKLKVAKLEEERNYD